MGRCDPVLPPFFASRFLVGDVRKICVLQELSPVRLSEVSDSSTSGRSDMIEDAGDSGRRLDGPRNQG